MQIIAIIEGILFLTKSEEEFKQIYIDGEKPGSSVLNCACINGGQGLIPSANPALASRTLNLARREAA